MLEELFTVKEILETGWIFIRKNIINIYSQLSVKPHKMALHGAEEALPFQLGHFNKTCFAFSRSCFW